MQTIDELSVNTLRFLSVEMIQKAKSGHPGLPMGAAPAAYALWAKEMKHTAKNVNWPDRDRFVLSAGHGSALLYALFHVFGYGISIEDLKQFRQKDSITPGHPEFRRTPGVEVTTGPLGQGIGMAVGMAWAERYLAEKFNRPGYQMVDHYTFALCGDGCLMEGISEEAASLAGTLGLGKLILLYDCNNITIEGSTETTFTENIEKRFSSYGWQVITVEDGNAVSAIAAAIRTAKMELEKPTLIKIKTQIGFGAPNKQGKASSHGEPLGEDEIEAAKKNLGWPYAESFFVPEEVKKEIESLMHSNEKKEAQWQDLYLEYKRAFPKLAEEWEQWHKEELADNLWEEESFWQYSGDAATRASSEQVLQKAASFVPNLIGGSADLAPSNKSIMKGRGDYSKENPSGSNLHFGIREFAMIAIANGMAAHGGLRPYVAGFFVFSDYMKAGLRLSALMGLPVISIFTHDSIGVGEDGPTHQPIEQLAALRSMPNFIVFRPCDTHETAAGWYVALTNKNTPTALILSRQTLPMLAQTGRDAVKGAYILKDSKKAVPDILLLASGSEVKLIVDAQKCLEEKGIDARIISMPSFELFEMQDKAYKERILPDSVRARLAVEAASDFGWHKYTGLDGDVIAMHGFGASAPGEVLFDAYGFTVEHVVERALAVVRKQTL